MPREFKHWERRKRQAVLARDRAAAASSASALAEIRRLWAAGEQRQPELDELVRRLSPADGQALWVQVCPELQADELAAKTARHRFDQNTTSKLHHITRKLLWAAELRRRRQKSAVAVGEGLDSQIPGLVQLATADLQWKRLGPAQADSLGKMLHQVGNLTTLHLQNNAIGDPGAEAIAEALISNNRLTALGLGANLIGDAGATAVIEALQRNHRPPAVSLSTGLMLKQRATCAQQQVLSRHTSTC